MNVLLFNKWKRILPDFQKMGKNKLVKFYPPVMIGIEFVANRFGKDEYCPHLFIESYIASHFSPSICYLNELKKSPDKKFWYFSAGGDIEDIELNSIVFENNVDFELLLNPSLTKYEIILYLEKAIQENWIIFGNMTGAIRLLCYLYLNLYDANADYKKEKYEYYREMITTDEGYKRLPEKFYNELLSDMQMYLENPAMTDEVIQKNINTNKLIKCVRHPLL